MLLGYENPISWAILKMYSFNGIIELHLLVKCTGISWLFFLLISGKGCDWHRKACASTFSYSPLQFLLNIFCRFAESSFLLNRENHLFSPLDSSAYTLYSVYCECVGSVLMCLWLNQFFQQMQYIVALFFLQLLVHFRLLVESPYTYYNWPRKIITVHYLN